MNDKKDFSITLTVFPDNEGSFKVKLDGPSEFDVFKYVCALNVLERYIQSVFGEDEFLKCKSMISQEYPPTNKSLN